MVEKVNSLRRHVPPVSLTFSVKLCLALVSLMAVLLGCCGHHNSEGTAPSGALIAMATGPLVAIPSIFAHNWLVHSIRGMTVEADDSVNEPATALEREFVWE